MFSEPGVKETCVCRKCTWWLWSFLISFARSSEQISGLWPKNKQNTFSELYSLSKSDPCPHWARTWRRARHLVSSASRPLPSSGPVMRLLDSAEGRNAHAAPCAHKHGILYFISLYNLPASLVHLRHLDESLSSATGCSVHLHVNVSPRGGARASREGTSCMAVEWELRSNVVKSMLEPTCWQTALRLIFIINRCCQYRHNRVVFPNSIY